MTDKHTTPLDDQAIALVKRLGGRWQGDTALCFCPAHDCIAPQLHVRVGARSILLQCSAGCDDSQIISAVAKAPSNAAAPKPSRQRYALNDHEATRQAKRLWDGALPIGGTSAERYLASLGIDTYASELRYAPRCSAFSGKSAIYHPALLAAVCDCDGLVAVERTYLRADGLALADIPSPKRMLGFPAGGLGRWSMVPSKILRLAADVEEAASAIIVGSQGIPVWPVFGCERYATIDVPPSIERIVIYARTSQASVQAIAVAADHLSADNRVVEVLYPPRCDSWNAYLRWIKG
jgi:putative DNA primase/helicase